MTTHSVSHGNLELSEHEIRPVSKWVKFLSITLFTQAIILFFLSFLLFFIKRTVETDPRMISGAFEGTTQLTYFVTVNIIAIILALQGYFLYLYRNENEIKDDYLRLFFKTASLSAIPVFLVVISLLLLYIL